MVYRDLDLDLDAAHITLLHRTDHCRCSFQFVHRPISRPLIASDLTLEELRQHRRATCAHPSEEFVDFKHVIMYGKIATSGVAVIMPMALPLVFLHCSLAQPSIRCGKLRTYLKRAKGRTVLQSGMYNIQTSGTHTNARNGAKLWSSVLSLPDGPHPTHSHPWKKTKRGDLGKEVDMLSLNTASRTCRVGVETARPQIRQVATFVEDSHLFEQAEIFRSTFARTDLGGK